MEGDELLKVNGQSLEGMTRAEVWSILKNLPDGKVELMAKRTSRRYF